MLPLQKINIRPIHSTFTTLGSTPTGYAFVAPFEETDTKSFKTFGDLTLPLAFKTSGYQYFVAVTKFFDEYIDGYDSLFSGRFYLDEYTDLIDQLHIRHVKYFDEYVDGTDDLDKTARLEDILTIRDDLFVAHTKVFDEYVNVTDIGDMYAYFDFKESTNISVIQVYDISNMINIYAVGYMDITDSTNIAVAPFSLALVTSASSSPFEPTVIIDGDTLISFPSTEP